MEKVAFQEEELLACQADNLHCISDSLLVRVGAWAGVSWPSR